MDGENHGSNPIKMDDLGVPLFLETPLCLHVHVVFPATFFLLLGAAALWSFARVQKSLDEDRLV